MATPSVLAVFLALLLAQQCGGNATVEVLDPLAGYANITGTPFLDALNNDTVQPAAAGTQRLLIGGLYDLRSFPLWPGRLMQFTIHLINNKKDGWHDDILPDAFLEGTMNDSACDTAIATRAYLNITRVQDPDRKPAAIYGCRCSGASMAVARLCGVENIAMLSPYSSSVKLSNEEEYPTFSRTAGPDNEQGQVGALIMLLRAFGWSRISVINTDTEYTQDISLELSTAFKGRRFDSPHHPDKSFVGEIGFSDTIKLNQTNDEVDTESVLRVLRGVPTQNPNVNSRVIVLFAHHQHAFPILKAAQEMNFQPDTIWIGVSEWIGRMPVDKDKDTSWMPPVPGYIGLTPYRNTTSAIYKDFLTRLQQFEWRHNLPLTRDLFDFAADKIVDGILALAMAFSALPPEDRRNGILVSRELRKLRFTGVSGPVAFKENGDFENPRFSVKTLSTTGNEWKQVGYVTPETVNIDFNRICYAQVGCVTTIPTDRYPVPPVVLPVWIWIVCSFLVVIFIVLVHQRWKNRDVTNKLQRIEEELQALDDNDDAVKARKGRLYKEVASLLGEPAPEHWTDEQGLVEIPPTEQEYWNVLEKLRATMNKNETCHLSRLCRVQNMGIYSYYIFRKNQLVNKYKTEMRDIEQISVWHGTSSLDPDVIYNDIQDGFMMQLSRQGFFGRGLYFSERSGYSDPYSFKPLTKYSDSDQVDRELFLVKLLVGELVFLDRNEGEWMREACRGLVTPPDNPSRNGLKFDTVKGEIDDEYGSKVYVVYENGRAYPEYLVRYYKGPRDQERTPYESLEEALEGEKSRELEEPEEEPHDSAATTLPDEDEHSVESLRQAIWQFEDDNKNDWVNYLEAHQIQIEQAYQRDKNGVTTIEHFPWTYVIDFSVNQQTNLDHPGNTSRRVRRIHMDHPSNHSESGSLIKPAL